MDLRFDVELPVESSVVFPFIVDLSQYPLWMPLLREVKHDGDEAWDVQLQAKVGPFARSKRLRMVRTDVVADIRAVFERVERDGRRHSDWLLRAEIVPIADGCRVVMSLHYGGALWGGVLERVLHDQVQQGRENLRGLVASLDT